MSSPTTLNPIRARKPAKEGSWRAFMDMVADSRKSLDRETMRMNNQFVNGVRAVIVSQLASLLAASLPLEAALTAVIEQAERFGLAQLHQLRGRVGRIHHQAYAYLMVPDVESLTKQAQQRLDAIQAMEELGSGFYLAMHDLEIRGAGEVLGENQSGNMLEVGFQLYNEMLAEAVRAEVNTREIAYPWPATFGANSNAYYATLIAGMGLTDVCVEGQLWAPSSHRLLLDGPTLARIQALA